MLAIAAASLLLCKLAAAQPPGAFAPRVQSPVVSEQRYVTFRVRASESDEVRLTGSDMPEIGPGLDLKKAESGVWEITIGPVASGTYRYRLRIDGVFVNDPASGAVSESNGNVWSLVHVPGAEWMDTNRVKHGAVAEVTYYSTALKRFRRMHVYTPPGYEAGLQNAYPVFYLLHGAFDCDDSWTTVGRAGFILDNLIAAGKAEPMIVVMPAGHTGQNAFGRNRPLVDQFTQDFEGHIVPYIDSNYRVKKGRANRAIAGLSMGGAQTMNIAFRNLDQYAYVGVFSSGVFGINGRGLGGGDGPSWEERHAAMLDDDKLKAGLELVWFATGKDDFLLETSRGTVEMLKNHKFDVTYRETAGGHTWINWREYLHAFSQQLFRTQAVDETAASKPEIDAPSQQDKGDRMATDASEFFAVAVDKTVNGSIVLAPAPVDGKCAAGTVITVTATPEPGYVLDSGYFSVPGRWGTMYHESMKPSFQVTVDRDKHIGASFIEEEAVEHIHVTQDVVYAQPGKKPLKYDVYSPKGAHELPCIVIIHGGGWSTNTEDIMRGLARELTKGGQFVVFSVDYRWAQKLDGDDSGNSMANIIEDVFGAIAHIMEHATEYGGDPTRIGVTGDSAGGHLSATASLMPGMIGDRGFGKSPGVFEFLPSYLPSGKTIGQVRANMLASIKAAAPSYGVFGGTLLSHYSEDPAADDSWKDAVAPLSHIPKASERAVPQYLLRGVDDFLIRDEMVTRFKDALEMAGQQAVYVQVEGAGHAFFDWKPDETTKATFGKYGVPHAARMKAFFKTHLH